MDPVVAKFCTNQNLQANPKIIFFGIGNITFTLRGVSFSSRHGSLADDICPIFGNGAITIIILKINPIKQAHWNYQPTGTKTMVNCNQ